MVNLIENVDMLYRILVIIDKFNKLLFWSIAIDNNSVIAGQTVVWAIFHLLPINLNFQ